LGALDPYKHQVSCLPFPLSPIVNFIFNTKYL
jgi:hypothetical protein